MAMPTDGSTDYLRRSGRWLTVRLVCSLLALALGLIGGVVMLTAVGKAALVVPEQLTGPAPNLTRACFDLTYGVGIADPEEVLRGAKAVRS